MGEKLQPDRSGAKRSQQSMHKEDSKDGNGVQGLTCHQCKRNDKGKVVQCTKCMTKRFCIPCIKTWYNPLETLDSIAQACPFCRGICNCKSCLRLKGTLKNRLEKHMEYNENEKKEYSMQILRSLFPILKQLSQDQLLEKRMEAERQGLSLWNLKVEQTQLLPDDRAYCNNCETSIFDFHRTCPNCSYDLCLTCCQEIRKGHLQGNGEQVVLEYVNHGYKYLHGGEPSFKRRKVDEGLKSDDFVYLKESAAQEWKANEDRTIPCPPESMGGCGTGLLELRCMFSDDWFSGVVDKAEELLRTYVEAMLKKCSCFSPDGTPKLGSCDFKKAASRAASSDNYLYYPKAMDQNHDTLGHFKLHWAKGEPIIVRNVLETSSGLWEPMVMWRALRDMSKKLSKSDSEHLVTAINCLDFCEVELLIHQFFKGYSECQFDSYSWPTILKLQDWPPENDFDERLPRHGIEIMSNLPFKEYTHPKEGFLNLAVKLPEGTLRPDLGPKMYVAYGVLPELGRGDSVIKLHYDKADVVYILTHTSDVSIPEKQLQKMRKIKKKHIAQDKREFFDNIHMEQDHKKESLSATPEQCDLMGDQTTFEGGKRKRGASDNSRMYIKKETDLFDHEPSCSDEEDTSSFFMSEMEEYSEGGGALWDIFRRQDVPKLEEYLKKHFKEFRHIHCNPLPQVFHPIHDGTFYLTLEHKRKLREEYGIEPWTFVQKLGDAVLIPAGCPYQIRNLKSCIHVGIDFVSPENVKECLRLTEEFRVLPKQHRAKEDKYEVKKMAIYAMSKAIEYLQTCPAKGEEQTKVITGDEADKEESSNQQGELVEEEPWTRFTAESADDSEEMVGEEAKDSLDDEQGGLFEEPPIGGFPDSDTSITVDAPLMDDNRELLENPGEVVKEGLFGALNKEMIIDQDELGQPSTPYTPKGHDLKSEDTTRRRFTVSPSLDDLLARTKALLEEDVETEPQNPGPTPLTDEINLAKTTLKQLVSLQPSEVKDSDLTALHSSVNTLIQAGSFNDHQMEFWAQFSLDINKQYNDFKSATQTLEKVDKVFSSKARAKTVVTKCFENLQKISTERDALEKDQARDRACLHTLEKQLEKIRREIADKTLAVAAREEDIASKRLEIESSATELDKLSQDLNERYTEAKVCSGKKPHALLQVKKFESGWISLKYLRPNVD